MTIIRPFIALIFYLLFHVSSGQHFIESLAESETKWLEKRNFPISFYQGSDSVINQNLTHALKLRGVHQLLLGGGGVSLAVFPLGGLLFFPLAGQVRGRFIANLNMATQKWLIDDIGLESYTSNEEFRGAEHVAWYKKENFLANYYDGEDPMSNELLISAFNLRERANKLYLISAISGGVGSALFIFGALQAFAGEDSAGTTLVASSILLLTAPITLISGLVYKGRARKNLRMASRKWYERIGQ